MQVVIRGHALPGRRCDRYENVHVALQVGSRPEGLVPGDADTAEWTTEVYVVNIDSADERDFRGPAVHGKRGDRFLYLTWGEVSGDGFAMFRRAKLMLDELPMHVPLAVADVNLTDGEGMPCCARLHDPAITWSVPASA